MATVSPCSTHFPGLVSQRCAGARCPEHSVWPNVKTVFSTIITRDSSTAAGNTADDDRDVFARFSYTFDYRCQPSPKVTMCRSKIPSRPTFGRRATGLNGPLYVNGTFCRDATIRREYKSGMVGTFALSTRRVAPVCRRRGNGIFGLCMERSLEHRYTIVEFCARLGNNATETFQTLQKAHQGRFRVRHVGARRSWMAGRRSPTNPVRGHAKQQA